MNGDLETSARYALHLAFGPGEAPATAAAPGRCTLVGEHVDYADGLVLCIGVNLGVAAAVRRSPSGIWRIVSGDRRLDREDCEVSASRRDVGDRVLAVVQALGSAGITVPPVEVALSADLPSGAGLSSSAALGVAVLVALLRLVRRALPAAEVARIALGAEHDVLGIPCGPLDQRAVVLARPGAALLLDCRDGGSVRVPWRLDGVVLAAVDTGSAHDVGGDGYRQRRAEADAALATLGVSSWRDVSAAALTSGEPRLGPPLDARARHITGETERAAEAALALRRGDAAGLGRLMSASHASLRDDYEVSGPELDAAVEAAAGVRGCLGARLVGAGFGGSAIALVEEAAAPAVRAAMVAAAGPRARPSWILEPAAGAAARAPDAVR